MIKELLNLVRGKRVFIATHWDADGISTGAMLYHTLKNHAANIRTLSKGKIFRIEGSDIPHDVDYVICTDVQPAATIRQPVIYIDHHPYETDGQKGLKETFALKIYDTSYQSSSYLCWDRVMQQTEEPYLLFLCLLGFFGDAGKANQLPAELERKALRAFPELMAPTVWPDGRMCLEIEKYVSSINVGKRMHWNGTVPFELLKSIERYEDFINEVHPLARDIASYKRELRHLYSMDVVVEDLGPLHLINIECPRNIQGVLCARHMDGKPILVLNKYDEQNVMGSMRVPEENQFDAGSFLQGLMGSVAGLLGGGHEKAGGVSFPAIALPQFYDAVNRAISEQYAAPKLSPSPAFPAASVSLVSPPPLPSSPPLSDHGERTTPANRY